MGGRRETQHLYKISKLLFWGLGMPILPCCTPFDLREALFFFTDMCLANMSPHDTDSYHGTRSSSPVHGCPSLHDKNDRSNENMPHAPYICTIPTFLQVCCMITCHHRSGTHQSLASRNMYPAWRWNVDNPKPDILPTRQTIDYWNYYTLKYEVWLARKDVYPKAMPLVVIC